MFQNNQSLPLQQPDSQNDQSSSTMRKRLSSVSLKNMSEYSAPATEWALRRTKSVSAMGENAGSSIGKWWESGWDWIMSRKLPVDLEMSEEEKNVLGCQNKSSWRHVFYKLKRMVVGSDRQSYFKSFDSRRNTIPH